MADSTSDPSAELEGLYTLGEEFYARLKEYDQKIAVLRCEQEETMNLYNQVMAKARDLELDND